MLLVVAIGGSALIVLLLATGIFQREDGLSAEAIANGRALYGQHCAGCHGANLEGQPDWQTPLPSGRLPAPPHDATGHTWHHPDRLLLAITKLGTATVVGRGHESDMPGFASVLDDEQIRAVLAFLKSTWPERERQYQREMSRRDAVDHAAGK